MFKGLLKKAFTISSIALSSYAFINFNTKLNEDVFCEKKQTKKINPLDRSIRKVPLEKLETTKFICGNANRKLAEEIVECLNTYLIDAKVGRFADGEINIQLHETVRGKDVFIIQPTNPPVNENLMELILLISAAKRAACRKITAVIPYFGYARQDRKANSRVPISASEVARMLEGVGIDRLISVDLHCPQIQGFFSPKVAADNLDGSVVVLDYLEEHKDLEDNPNKIVVVSPDAGGVYRAKKFYENLKKRGYTQTRMAVIIKQRGGPNIVETMWLVGEVKDSTCIIIDDMIDTAGTFCMAANLLKEKGAKKVFGFATHGLFSGKAFESVKNSKFDKLIVTNSIPLKDNAPKNIIQLSVGTLIAEAIRRIHQGETLSEMFDF